MNANGGRIAGRVALISGGASGIGLASATRFVAEGARVTITDRDTSAGKEAAQGLGEQGRFVAQDVTDEAGWEAIVADCVKVHGGLDILVNCAGIFRPGSIEHTTLDEWRATIDVNLEGTFLGCRAAVRVMKAKGGAIVNISSVAGLVGDADYAAYDASKGAVRLLTKSIAVYCAREKYDIRCNSVHPGSIDTPMTRHLRMTGAEEPESEHPVRGRYGRPEEVAALILFLVSDEAGYINGAEFTIDDGDTAGLGFSYRGSRVAPHG